MVAVLNKTVLFQARIRVSSGQLAILVAGVVVVVVANIKTGEIGLVLWLISPSFAPAANTKLLRFQR